ncbi:MAG: SO2930 family diheme c-type cytochrome [Pseudomonadota bacterium]
MSLRAALLVLWAALLAACAEETPPPVAPSFHEAGNPERLSDWGVIAVRDRRLILSEGVFSYDLATPLFSDYALKLRTVWMPDGAAARYDARDVFDFPVGTIITKTFYYPQEDAEWTGAVAQGAPQTLDGGALSLDGLRLIETRVLARRADGWTALPYVWNDEQAEATLKRTGAVKPLTLVRGDGRREDFAYLVPNQNQCAGCHAVNATTRALHPIGPKARHLNKPSPLDPSVNQLDDWRARGMLVDAAAAGAAPRNADWRNAAAPLDARARAYLDANCTHCHSAVGPADTSGLNFEPDVALSPALGLCKSPIAAGAGSGGRLYDIAPGDPEASITVYRMKSTDPGSMMPELGRAVAHEEGVALIAAWIASLDGACG